MADAQNYTLKIRRFDPESGETAHWQDFDVDVPPERSVLDGILQARTAPGRLDRRSAAPAAPPSAAPAA